jgi:peptidoglycan-associated lipoprotein
VLYLCFQLVKQRLKKWLQVPIPILDLLLAQLIKRIAVGDRVLFDYDSSKLDSSAKILLDAQSRFLRANSDLNFIVEGHCDERGTREYNLALGEQRATAVRDYLVIQGIDPDRIKVISYGKEKPAVVGSNSMAWSKNRRAVTIIN